MSARVTLFFEPLDALLFRDHRPFDAGYGMVAQGQFPQPTVFRGCVRTALFRRCGADFYGGGDFFGLRDEWARELLGGRKQPGSLHLRGPLLARWSPARTADKVEPFFPWPLDVVSRRRDCESTEAGREHAILQTKALGGGAAGSSRGMEMLHGHGRELVDVPGPILWTDEEPDKHAGKGLLSRAGAKTYVTSSGADVAFGDQGICARDTLYKDEDRVGIARDPDRLVAAEHMLYLKRAMRFQRCADSAVGFAVDVAMPTGDEGKQAIRDLHGMIVPLGGKGHRASIRVIDEPLLPADLPVALGAEPGAAYALWLLTPMPLGHEIRAWPEGVHGVTGRPVLVGGFDMAGKAPRPLRRALPAGTVLHVRGKEPEQVLCELGGSTWKDDRRAGFGVAVVRHVSGDTNG